MYPIGWQTAGVLLPSNDFLSHLCHVFLSGPIINIKILYFWKEKKLISKKYKTFFVWNFFSHYVFLNRLQTPARFSLWCRNLQTFLQTTLPLSLFKKSYNCNSLGWCVRSHTKQEFWISQKKYTYCSFVVHVIHLRI